LKREIESFSKVITCKIQDTLPRRERRSLRRGRKGPRETRAPANGRLIEDNITREMDLAS